MWCVVWQGWCAIRPEHHAGEALVHGAAEQGACSYFFASKLRSEALGPVPVVGVGMMNDAPKMVGTMMTTMIDEPMNRPVGVLMKRMVICSSRRVTSFALRCWSTGSAHLQVPIASTLPIATHSGSVSYQYACSATITHALQVAPRSNDDTCLLHLSPGCARSPSSKPRSADSSAFHFEPQLFTSEKRRETPEPIQTLRSESSLRRCSRLLKLALTIITFAAAAKRSARRSLTFACR